MDKSFESPNGTVVPIVFQSENIVEPNDVINQLALDLDDNIKAINTIRLKYQEVDDSYFMQYETVNLQDQFVTMAFILDEDPSTSVLSFGDDNCIHKCYDSDCGGSCDVQTIVNCASTTCNCRTNDGTCEGSIEFKSIEG